MKKNKDKAGKQFNKELQLVLGLLPCGPIQLHNSKTFLQYFRHSVQVIHC